MKTKEEILGHVSLAGELGMAVKVVTHDTALQAIQEYSDQQNAQLREAFLELLYNNYSKEYAKPEINKWLEKAGLKEKE